MILLLSAVLLLLLFVYKLHDHGEPPPIFGVYRQKSRRFYLKYLLFRIVLFLRKRFASKGSGFGVNQHVGALDLDKAQPLADHIKAFDAVFFIGANSDGFYFALGSERRQNNVVNGLFYLVVPELGLLCSNKLPDTVLFGAEEGEFGAEGILMEPLVPMTRWKLSYSGKMWSKKNPEKVFSVEFNADWRSHLDYFNYDTDLHPGTVARAVAKEKWTRQHFQNMQKSHQSRYEQMGYATADVSVGDTKYSFKCQSFRDHGYGKVRDWSLMHRYAFFHIFLQDGTTAAVGVVCQPSTCSTIETGFVCQPSGKLVPVEWCDLQLYQHGEDGTPPKDHAFQFKAGSTVYTVQVNVEHESTHYVGWNWEARMVERFVKYKVNGVPGHGVSEFHYRYKQGRPNYINYQDPNWFQIVRKGYIDCTC